VPCATEPAGWRPITASAPGPARPPDDRRPFRGDGAGLRQFGFTLLALIPNSVLGVLLIFAGLELCPLIRSLKTNEEYFVALLISGIALAVPNMPGPSASASSPTSSSARPRLRSEQCPLLAVKGGGSR